MSLGDCGDSERLDQHVCFVRVLNYTYLTCLVNCLLKIRNAYWATTKYDDDFMEFLTYTQPMNAEAPSLSLLQWPLDALVCCASFLPINSLLALCWSSHPGGHHRCSGSGPSSPSLPISWVNVLKGCMRQLMERHVLSLSMPSSKVCEPERVEDVTTCHTCLSSRNVFCRKKAQTSFKELTASVGMLRFICQIVRVKCSHLSVAAGRTHTLALDDQDW